MHRYANLPYEERIGLLVALILHLLVVAAFVCQPVRREVLEIPERMTVSLTEDVGLRSPAPDPVVQSRAALAPEPSPPNPAPATQQTPTHPQPTPPKKKKETK